MKWFWYSLLVFCLLMCSCRTQKVGSEVDFTTKENVKTNYTKYQALADTSNVLKIEIDKSKLKITETITTKKYDKDTGAITEETTTEREITQDSDKVSTEEANQAVTNSNQLEVDHIVDKHEMVDSEVTEESIGGQESFGKWLGIVIGIGIILGIIYLCKKLRIN